VEGDPKLRAALASGSLAAAIGLDLEAHIEARNQIFGLLDDWLIHHRFATIFEAGEGAKLKGVIKSRDNVRDLFNHLETLVCDLYFILVGTPERIVNLDLQDKLEQLSSRTCLEDIRNLLSSTARAKRDLSGMVSPLTCFDTVWLESLKIG
jgi:hypothetical protein